MCRAERSNLWFAIQCHYSEVIRIFFSKHLSFPNSILNFFPNYDVTCLEKFIQSRFEII